MVLNIQRPMNRLLSIAELAAFHLMRRLFLVMGVDRASAFSGWLWRKIAPMTERQRRAKRHVMASLPTLDEQTVSRVLNGMWDNLGRTTAEGFFLEQIIKDPNRFECDAATYEALVLAKAKGAVFVSGHIGNWELGAPLLWANGLEAAGIYRHIKSAAIDHAVRSLRERFYKAGLWKLRSQAARAALKAADQGKSVMILADQRDGAGLVVPFFNQPAPSTPFPALISRERAVPLFAARVRRIKGVRFAFETVRIDQEWSDDRQADLYRATARLQAQLESWITNTPEQWMWAHKRWGGTLPPLETKAD
jgi:Kdo2-lipid IVA lauroyltransferase/acyltransferase